MKNRLQRRELMSRRAFVLGGLQLLGLGGLFARLVQVQVVHGARYRMLAEENRINMRLLLPARGLLLDRYGQPLAGNRPDYRVQIIAERAGDTRVTIAKLASLINISPEDIERTEKLLRRTQRFMPVTLRGDLTWEDVTKVELNIADLPGVEIAVGQTRDYPLGTEGVHVLGYVAPVPEGTETRDPLLRHPDMRIGKSGLERFYDETLRGQAGAQQIEINAAGRLIRELDRQPGQDGAPLTLTLDRDIQQAVATRILAEKSGAAAVLEIASGNVVALVASPGFNPERLHSDWNNLIKDDTAPLLNKVIAGQYAPGSTFKMVVLLAALEAGIISANWGVNCIGHVDLGSHRFHCWKRGGHGYVDGFASIVQSCDVYYYELARRVGPERIADAAAKLGLGAVTGIDLPGEKAGLVPSPDWVRRVHKRGWLPGETYNFGIGQGALLTTPVQLAVMTARLISGQAVVPRLRQGAGVVFPDLGFKNDTLKLLKRAMDAVVQTPSGTAYGSRVRGDFSFGGKTGTSQVRRISRSERATGIIPNNERPWRERDHALFVGYAPLAEPRYAFSVLIEHGGGGGAVAAPIGKYITQLLAARDAALQGQSPPTPLPPIVETAPPVVAPAAMPDTAAMDGEE